MASLQRPAWRSTRAQPAVGSGAIGAALCPTGAGAQGRLREQNPAGAPQRHAETERPAAHGAWSVVTDSGAGAGDPGEGCPQQISLMHQLTYALMDAFSHSKGHGTVDGTGNPPLPLEDLRFVGSGLVRPECVLANAAGDLFTADWRGGVAHLRPDGSRAL